MNQQNLISLPRQIAAKQARAVRRWVGITSSYLLAIIFVSAICYFADRPVSPASQQLEPIAAEIGRANAELVSLRATTAIERRQLQSLLEISDQPDWSVLLRVVSGLLGDSVVLENVDLGPEISTTSAKDTKPVVASAKSATIVHLNGVGRSQGAITELVLRLEALHFF